MYFYSFVKANRKQKELKYLWSQYNVAKISSFIQIQASLERATPFIAGIWKKWFTPHAFLKDGNGGFPFPSCLQLRCWHITCSPSVTFPFQGSDSTAGETKQQEWEICFFAAQLWQQRQTGSWNDPEGLGCHAKGLSFQFSSVYQSSLILCNPMDRSTPGLPVHHQLPEFTQTPVHWVGDAIQPSHPLLAPSPPDFNVSQHQGLFKWVSSLHQVAKVLELRLQNQSFQWTTRTDLL